MKHDPVGPSQSGPGKARIPMDLPAVAADEVLDVELGDAAFRVSFGDIFSEAGGCAVVVPDYHGGAVLAAALRAFPSMHESYFGDTQPRSGPVKIIELAPSSADAPTASHVILSRYMQQMDAAYITGHWVAMAEALDASDTGRAVTTIRTPAFGVLNGRSFFQVARCILYGATTFLLDPALRRNVRRVELVLRPDAERVFGHIKLLVDACGPPPVRSPCIVCSTFPRDVVALSCGHWAVCSSCWHRASKQQAQGATCPVCRQASPDTAELLVVRPCPEAHWCCDDAKAGVAYRNPSAVWSPCGHAGAECEKCEKQDRSACPVCEKPGKRVPRLFPA